MQTRKRSIVSAQPGWYSVTLSNDQSELEECPVIAWMFEHYNDGKLGLSKPITLSGDVSSWSWQPVKAPMEPIGLTVSGGHKKRS